MKGLLRSASFWIVKINVLGTFCLMVYVVHTGAAYAPVAASSRIIPHSVRMVCITYPFLSCSVDCEVSDHVPLACTAVRRRRGPGRSASSQDPRDRESDSAGHSVRGRSENGCGSAPCRGSPGYPQECPQCPARSSCQGCQGPRSRSGDQVHR